MLPLSVDIAQASNRRTDAVISEGAALQDYMDMGRLKKVYLYQNGTIAIVEAVSPELGNRVQRVRVQLPGTSQVWLSSQIRALPLYMLQLCTDDQVAPLSV